MSFRLNLVSFHKNNSLFQSKIPYYSIAYFLYFCNGFCLQFVYIFFCEKVLTKNPFCGILYKPTAKKQWCFGSEKRSGSIAQLGEHLPYKQRVTGSSPVVPTTLRRKIFGSVVQLVRTPPCHGGGRGFEPHPSRQPERVTPL